MLGINAMQKCSNFAKAGNYRQAQAHQWAWTNQMMDVHNAPQQVASHQFRGHANMMYNAMQEEANEE